MTDERTERTLEAEGAMFADLRELVLRHVREREAPWSECSEGVQAEIIADVDRTCRDAIRDAVRTVARHEWPGLAAEVVQVVFRDKGVRAVLDIPAAGPDVYGLAGRTGLEVMVVLVSPTVFMTVPPATEPDPDQMTLGLETDADDPDPAGEGCE